MHFYVIRCKLCAVRVKYNSYQSSCLCWCIRISFGCVYYSVWAYILKGGARGARTPQTILNFPQKDCLRTRKVSRLHCLQSYWRSFPLFMFSHWNKLSIKTLKQYILNKNSTLTPNSCDFYDLRTFVAKFCRCDLRTFSAEFWRLKRQNPQTESLSECMP